MMNIAVETLNFYLYELPSVGIGIPLRSGIQCHYYARLCHQEVFYVGSRTRFLVQERGFFHKIPIFDVWSSIFLLPYTFCTLPFCIIHLMVPYHAWKSTEHEFSIPLKLSTGKIPYPRPRSRIGTIQ